MLLQLLLNAAVAVPPPRGFSVRTAQNNCYGDPPACWFRGRTDSAQQCETVCAADPACRSFTWVGKTGDSFEHECRTRNDTTWKLVPETEHTAGYRGLPPVPPPFRCRNATDCNNAGRCDVASGHCRCDPTWRGDTCAELSLLPAQSVGNGDSVYVTTNHTSMNTWGGSIVAMRDSFHMFAAGFPNGTLNDWETDSIVIHLKSRGTIEGPYVYIDTVAAPRRDAHPPLWDSLDCHNPTIHKLGDEFVVFYIGVGVNVSSSGGSGSSSLSSSAQASGLHPELDKAQTIGAAFAMSPDGPWTRLKTPLLTATEPWECGGGTDCGVSNPAVLVRPDGKLNLFYRGNQDRGVGVATADSGSWRGPWKKSRESVESNGIFRGNSVIGLEDLYVWPNPKTTGRPGCHMILHQEEAGIENLGAHAFTEDPTCVSGWRCVRDDSALTILCHNHSGSLNHQFIYSKTNVSCSCVYLVHMTRRLSSPRPSHAYGPEFAWANGTVTKFASRERPQVVLDAATGWPTHLSNGVITSGWSGISFTVVAPINNTAG